MRPKPQPTDQLNHLRQRGSPSVIELRLARAQEAYHKDGLDVKPHKRTSHPWRGFQEVVKSSDQEEDLDHAEHGYDGAVCSKSGQMHESDGYLQEGDETDVARSDLNRGA